MNSQFISKEFMNLLIIVYFYLFMNKLLIANKFNNKLNKSYRVVNGIITSVFTTILGLEGTGILIITVISLI